MKSKFLKVLTVSLIVLAIIAPSLVVCGVILEHHIKLENSQYLVYEFNQSIKGNSYYTCNQQNTYILQAAELHTCHATNFINPLFPFNPQKAIFYILLRLIFFALPGAFYLGLFVCNQYFVYRTAVLNRQVKMLERLWQQSIPH